MYNFNIYFPAVCFICVLLNALFESNIASFSTNYIESMNDKIYMHIKLVGNEKLAVLNAK
jgi:hypothetical protein